jgi:hypothetical protein
VTIPGPSRVIIPWFSEAALEPLRILRDTGKFELEDALTENG